MILGFAASPIQTYHFEPDIYYDVTDVMPQYVELVNEVDAIRAGGPVSKFATHEIRALNGSHPPFVACGHALIQIAEMLRNGQRSGCRYALGFRTVWGNRRGPNIL